MKIVVYIYTDPLLDTVPNQGDWGWEIDKIYEDLGKRTQLKQLLTDCQTETINYLLVHRLEELGDNLAQISDNLNQLETMGVIVIATQQPYTSNSSQIQTEMLELLQEIQNQQRSRRIRQGHARNRLEALPPPGKSPYGYRRGQGKYIIDRTTSPVVKDFFEQFLLYGSLRAAVRFLSKKYGKNISVTTGRRWLTNPVYRGDTTYQNSEIISNTHAAIISRAEAAQIDRLLRRNSRLPSRTASAPRSLAGLVTCNQCQSQMIVTSVTQRHQDKEYLYLRATDCPQQPKCRAIPYQVVLEKTIDHVCRDLPLAVAGINFPQLDTIKNSLGDKIFRQEQILQQLPTLIETGILDIETAKLRAYKLRTEISELQAQLAILPPVNLSSVAQAVSIPQFWLDLSEVERRFYFREFIQKIQIIRQNREWYLQVIFIF
ncbi:MAG: recombinase family protein [Aphanizomenon flos-aquae Clear-A1]|jgi:DNA invertase Pin-like site-specific DNA recombinase|uniref:Recombinase n=1 Tax=Aphanizomenon flos-aquae WA102 TaxID=1710896 RepID=A0A1B7X457_APHFL|nr:recombinase family protein [Aphanizomenon flos-aquae Clear-A1]NTW20926.1 recombinase family protein [Nostocales cyanobacterium W4_Combined_metabat2_030]OBQ19505.1 MAG: recombinase [Anabaena sp. WA113]OBQ30766.1 MAG: recombinase [Aphanizomenon flos-aquae MDT14a]OBQ44159.1 MAG: recombinase [Aphanizomenon flos-aquae WA102]QSV68445.1 MAG: recombinase family protein [Aphanizomenon flos-aquae DEX188]